MNRYIEAELLDALPPEDPRAVGSRRDLRRVNACMGNARTAARALGRVFPKEPPRCLVDLGAGDGSFMLRLARQLPRGWHGVRVILLDKQNSVRPKTYEGLKRLGWHPEVLESDVLDWLRAPSPRRCDGLIANLFLHHFSEPLLAELLERAAALTRVFVAVEPRRTLWGLVLCRLLWLLGCNAVTRHDAPISVRAGFCGRELSQLWPAAIVRRRAGWSPVQLSPRTASPSLTWGEERAGERKPKPNSKPAPKLPGSAARVWSLHEGRAGLASHAFLAWKSWP